MITIIERTKKDSLVKQLSDIKPNTWIDLYNPDENEIETIKKKIDIPEDFITSSLDIEETPRIEKENGTILIILKVPIVRKGEQGNDIETTTLGIIITGSYFITIHRERVSFLEPFFKGSIKRFYTDKKTRLLLQILYKMIQKFIKYSRMLQKATEEVERELFISIDAEDIIKIWRIRQAIIYLNDAVIGNGKVLESILKGRVVKLFKSDEEIIEDLIIENNQLTRTISLMTELMASTMDAYVSLISNNLNVVMKRLTSIALIISVPTAVSSIYGMNIALPLQHNPHAFAILMILSFLISIILLMWFRKKKWV